MKRERLDFLADNPHYTKRFAYYVGRRCRAATSAQSPKDLPPKIRSTTISICGPMTAHSSASTTRSYEQCREQAQREASPNCRCKMVAIPTLAQEDAERPNRERESLVGEQSRIVKRMTAALARLGIRAPACPPSLRQPRSADPSQHIG